MGELALRVEKLRAPLAECAKLGFAVPEDPGPLAAALRRDCDRVLAKLDVDEAAELTRWRRDLDQFEALEADRQSVEIARGLRLCRSIAGRPLPSRPSPAVVQTPATADVQTLPGIGPALAQRLAERGLCTLEDLLWVIPRRYDDVRNVLGLGEALAVTEAGERLTARGRVKSCQFFRRGRRRWVDMRLADADPTAGFVVIRWFNAHPSMAKRFPVGTEIAVSGRVSVRGGVSELANPDVLSATGPQIIARYPDIGGVPPATLRKACASAVSRAAAHVADAVPAEIAQRQGLPPLQEALRCLHEPPETLSPEEVGHLNAARSQWHRRLAFDELFVLGVAVAVRRQQQRSDRAASCPPIPLADVQAALPFELTSAQTRAAESIAGDMARNVPMNRLLQGDVGSGKTAVAFAAACQAIAAGRQVAIMAPTAILAEQHYAGMLQWCRVRNIQSALLTAATPRGARASTLSLLGSGSIQLLVGTHSLIADSVQFDALGLVVVDEQHRFGVAQRVRLRAKGDELGAPHLLVMTATPIPRTLALTAYGDLDVTVIDELPPGRTPAKTLVVGGEGGRRTVYTRLAKRLANGERTFVVCPLVEPGEEADGARDWRDATTTASELARLLPDADVGLVHGRMSSADRDEQMARFRDGRTNVLVATTVIEVGVDVPEATVMIVEDAHHFGLSQLHQLRGRVGRGGGESHCILLTRGSKTPDAARRLEVMSKTSDGFRIAEEDLLIRGPGELIGVRQAGLPRLRFGDLTQHAELLVKARDEADRLLAESPELDRPQDAVLRSVLEQRSDVESAFGAEGG